MVERHRRRDDAPDVSADGLRSFFEAVAVLQAPDGDPERRYDFLGPRPNHDQEFDQVQIYSGFMIGGPPSAALNVLLLLCDNAPNDQALCFLGVQLVEPLLDLHWKEIGSAFETEVRRRPALRKALSCAWLDLNGKAGKDFERRLRTLVGPDDHVGH